MNERILVVDDEEDLRLSLKFKLKSAGFDVDVAADGEEALEKLKAKPADAVLLDITMPRMSGIEALTVIRQKYPQTEIIMVTGMQDVKTAVECMHKGAFYYVAKPYYESDLLGLIERALERKRLVMQNEALKSELARCVLSANMKSENDDLEAVVKQRTVQLQDAMELNERVFATSRLGLFACREDGPCIMANPAVARISGASVEQMLKLNFRELNSWKENGLFEKVETALKTLQEQTAEIHLKTSFGRDAWINYNITTFRSSGRLHFLMITEDITERKLAEQKLSAIKVSEDAALEYAESIINTVREPLIALDQDLRVVTVSRSFYEFFKVKPEETVGQLIYDLGNKQWDIPKLRELLENILPQQATFDNYEVKHDFATIGRRTMLLNARQIRRVLGKERIILLAIEDITERKEIEAGLEKTRKELAAIKKTADEVSEFAQSVINTVREPLISLDQDLRVVTVSRSFYDFFKVKPEETVGQLIYDLGNKQWDIPKLRELLETIIPGKAAFDNYEVEHDFATIGRRTMLLNARQIERVLGKERIILLAIEDITERKEIEAGLEKTRLELAVIKKTADEVSEFADSVINTVREPLISLDQDLRVVTVSRSFYDFFKVKPEETVGQLIYDLGNRQWDIPKLRELLETILPQQATFDNYEVEHDFATIGRRTMLLNARQIQRVLGRERIILLAIEDITERKEIEAGLEETRKELAVIKKTADEVSEFAESVINTVREPLISLDQDLRVVTVSRSFYDFFKVKPEETVGQLIYDLGNKQWNIPKLRELLETMLPQKASFDNYEVEHDFATIGRRIMLLNARQIERGIGKERIILLAIEDITERKRAEQERESVIGELKTALENVKTLDGLVPICAHCKKIRDDKGYWNQLEKYIVEHTDAKLTHGLCPDCAELYFPGIAVKGKGERGNG